MEMAFKINFRLINIDYRKKLSLFLVAKFPLKSFIMTAAVATFAKMVVCHCYFSRLKHCTIRSQKNIPFGKV